VFALLAAIAMFLDAASPAPTQAAAAGFDQGVDSATCEGGYNGTMTVDIVQVDPSDGFLKADVRDATDAENDRQGTQAGLIIRPDGTLVVTDGKIDEDMATIVPYLGTSFFADHPLQQGAQWVSDSTSSDGVDYETTTTVSSVDGDVANISIVTADVVMIRRASGDSADASRRVHYHFDRTSDTLDKTSGH